MANTFEMVCTLKTCKQTEKFTPIETRTFDSGWVVRNVRFNAVSGMNRHMLEIRGGAWQDDAKNEVRTYTRTPEGRTERITIPWKDRMKPDMIAQVAGFRQYVVDMGDGKRRTALQGLLNAFDNGTVTDEMMDKLSVSSESEAKQQLADLNEQRHVFITEWDFAECVQRMLESGAFEGKKFLVRGNIELSEYNGKIVTRYLPTKIYLDASDDEYKAEGTFVVVYGKDALDSIDLHSTRRYIVNAYSFSYDGRRKKQIPIPLKFVLPVGEDQSEKQQGILFALSKSFTIKKTDGVAYKELGVKCDLINGAEAIPLTRDMLTDNEIELLDLGVVTMEDIQRDRGNVVYGERKTEWVIKNFARGWMSGAKPTVYTDDDMVISDEEDELDI